MATILVVDDEMGIRELLSEILSDEGHVVELAEHAQAAREFRLRQVPDLVLLDIWMPDTDGVTLLKEWAAQSLLTMPVIMMSGHATIDTAVEATKIGALNFLEKPIALQKLLKAVEQGLARGAAAPMAAQASANTLLKRYGSLWGGAKLQIVRADLGAKGVYFRVMLPTASAADAVAVCSTIKANGGQCVANR